MYFPGVGFVLVFDIISYFQNSLAKVRTILFLKNRGRTKTVNFKDLYFNSLSQH